MTEQRTVFCPIHQREEPEVDGDTSYCVIHDAHEPLPLSAYVVCFECGHVYATAKDLVDAYNKAAAYLAADRTLDMPGDERGNTPPKRLDQAATILFCQECIHDF